MVSVCIATYNGEKFISKQLCSILEQIKEDDEIIVSDDGSVDNTVEIIHSFNDRRIKVIKNIGKHGFKDNFENALKFAHGDYIFLSDQDDVWLPEKYTLLCKILLKYDLVVSNSSITDEDLNILEVSFFDYIHSGPGILKNIIRNTYYGSCMAFRKKILEQAMPFPKSNEIGHDIWLGLVAEITGKVFFYPKSLLLYRRHAKTCTSTDLSFNRSSRSLFIKLYGRYIILFHVLKFIIKNKFVK